MSGILKAYYNCGFCGKRIYNRNINGRWSSYEIVDDLPHKGKCKPPPVKIYTKEEIKELQNEYMTKKSS